MIPIYKPYLNEEILSYAHDALDSTWISSTGKYKDLAEELLKEILGVKYVVLNNSGTSSMHLVASCLKFKHPNITKIIVPNNVYVAAWNPFLMGLGYELIPVDADILSWNMDLDYCKDIDTDTALLAVHNLGNIVNIPSLQKKYPNLVIVEDACEGLFGTHNYSAAGTKSLAAALSFFGNKTVTSGEGGAFLTNDEDLYHHASKLTGQGQTYHTRYLHDRLGYNYRMTNVQAAILYGQLKSIDDICSRKEVIFEIYRSAFDNTHLVYQNPEEGTCHSNWVFGLRFPGKNAKEIATFLRKKGIDTRPMFFPFSHHDHLKVMSRPDNEKVATMLHNEVLILPSFPDLTNKEVKYIIDTIKEEVCQITIPERS